MTDSAPITALTETEAWALYDLLVMNEAEGPMSRGRLGIPYEVQKALREKLRGALRDRARGGPSELRITTTSLISNDQLVAEIRKLLKRFDEL